MTVLVRFLIYNLLVSLAAGLLAWLLVWLALRLLRLGPSPLGFCFLGLPALKALLLLWGVGAVFPWPAALFGPLHAQAVPFQKIWPYLLVWTLGLYLVYRLAVARARRALLRAALPATTAAPRLAAALVPLQAAYRQAPCPPDDAALLCACQAGPPPDLLVSERLPSPLALTDGGRPAILFPAGLVAGLDDAELAGALAHELAHFVLRRRQWCSAGTLQVLTLMSPLAGMAGEYLHREEEKACDALAVALTGQPACYAGMLTKSYRFARQPARRSAAWLELMPRLAGFRPLLSERVEHLLAPARSAPPRPQVLSAAVWLALAAVLFFNGLR